MGVATKNQISDALADQIAGYLASVTDITIHVESHWFETAELPAIDIYHTAANGLEGIGVGGMGELMPADFFNIRVRVSAAALDEGQRLLYDLVDEETDLSIVAALDSDHTLGGLAFDVAWGEWSGIRDFPDLNSDGVFIGETLPIMVLKARS